MNDDFLYEQNISTWSHLYKLHSLLSWIQSFSPISNGLAAACIVYMQPPEVALFLYELVTVKFYMTIFFQCDRCSGISCIMYTLQNLFQNTGLYFNIFLTDILVIVIFLSKAFKEVSEQSKFLNLTTLMILLVYWSTKIHLIPPTIPPLS